jgi:hypothetical protein
MSSGFSPNQPFPDLVDERRYGSVGDWAWVCGDLTPSGNALVGVDLNKYECSIHGIAHFIGSRIVVPWSFDYPGSGASDLQRSVPVGGLVN